MNLENIAQPINTRTVEEHEQILENKMLDVELHYVENVFQKKIPPVYKRFSRMGISELISECTEVFHVFKNALMDKMGDKYSQEDFDAYMQDIGRQVEVFYEKDRGNWIKNTEELVQSELAKMKQGENKKPVDDSENRAGLLHFFVETMESKKSHREYYYKIFEKLGVDGKSPFMSIHLEDFYKQKNEGVRNIFSGNSLSKLASKIVDEHPEVKMITAESWLMDTPIAERVGFTVLKKEDKKRLRGYFWSQFIKSDGQLDAEKVSKFLETGKSPHEVRIGFIKVEDFLRKYLPLEKRGKIVLRDARPGFEMKLQQETDIINNIFKSEKITEEDIEENLKSCEILRDFSMTDHGLGIIEFIKKLKFDKKTRDEIKNNPKFIGYNKYFKEFTNSIGYIDKEVFI